jgi:hypothetical protein
MMSKTASNPLTHVLRLACLLALLAVALPASADVESVPIGIKFTHQAPGASQVFLAGSWSWR